MARREHRRSDGTEVGFTLAEMIVVSALTLVVLLMAYQILRVTTSTAQSVGYQASNATNAREALDDLEANLRYADGFWLLNSTNAVVADNSSTITSSSNAVSGPVLVVENSAARAFGGQPYCATWAISSNGLTEATDPTGSGTFGNANLVMPGVAAVGSSAFTLELTNLLEIDFTENQEPRKTTDMVTVHDLISPDNSNPNTANSTNSQAITSGSACS